MEKIPVEALNKPYYIGTDSPQKGGAKKFPTFKGIT